METKRWIARIYFKINNQPDHTVKVYTDTTYAGAEKQIKEEFNRPLEGMFLTEIKSLRKLDESTTESETI